MLLYISIGSQLFSPSVHILFLLPKRLQPDFSGFVTESGQFWQKSCTFITFHLSTLSCSSTSLFFQIKPFIPGGWTAQASTFQLSLAENLFFPNLFLHLSPVYRWHRNQPKCFTNRSTDQGSSLTLYKTSTFLKLSPKLNILRFCSRGGQFLQFHTEFHCSELLLSSVDEERMRKCPV